MYLKKSTILVLMFLMQACVNDESTNSTVWVYQNKGAKSCQPESGLQQQQVRQPLDDFNIEVMCQGIGTDGLLVPDACGMNTNDIYAFEIFKDKLIDAENLGFLLLDELDNAQIEVSCSG